MKYYYIRDKKGNVEVQERKKGITLTRKMRLKEQGKEIFQIIDTNNNFFEKMLDK